MLVSSIGVSVRQSSRRQGSRVGIHGRQLKSGDDVTRRILVRSRGAEVCVGHDGAALHLHAVLLEAEPRGVGDAADRYQTTSAVNSAPELSVTVADSAVCVTPAIVALVVALILRRRNARSTYLEMASSSAASGRGSISTMVHVVAERRPDVGELESDGTATDNHEVARHGPQRERLVAGDHPLPHHCGYGPRRRPGCEHDVLSVDRGAIDVDRVLVMCTLSRSAKEYSALTRIGLRCARRRRPRRSAAGLGRYATAVQAGATDVTNIDEGYFQSQFGCAYRRA